MPPSWLNTVGAFHKVDPEFFRRHLHFTLTANIVDNFSAPALSSSSWNLIELPVITLGRRFAAYRVSMRAKEIEELRKGAAKAMECHHHEVANYHLRD